MDMVEYSCQIKRDSIITNGIFGDMLDLNDDGNPYALEQGVEFMFIDEVIKAESVDLDNDDL